MFSRRIALRFLVLMTAVPLVMTGCLGKQPQDTKAPVNEARLGIIDINKTIKAHPRYNEYQTLKLQINALNYQLEAKTQQPAPNAMPDQLSEFQQTETVQGVEKNRQIEQNAKLSSKWHELDAQYQKMQLDAKQAALAELEAYSKELDKEYLMPLFNLKLKQSASLAKDEAEAAQAEQERLETLKKQKYTAKAAAVESRISQAVAAEYERLQTELAAYQAELNKEAAVQAANTAVDSQPFPNMTDSAEQVKLTEQLTELQQKLALLEQQIMEDIQNKTGQVAAEKGLDTVITNVEVNVRAMDITDFVIAGLKK